MPGKFGNTKFLISQKFNTFSNHCDLERDSTIFFYIRYSQYVLCVFEMQGFTCKSFCLTPKIIIENLFDLFSPQSCILFVRQNGEMRRKEGNVDDDDFAGLRRHDATRIRLRKTENDFVAVGVRRKHFTGRRKSSNSGKKHESISGLIEDRQIVVNIFNVD